jgi:DNA-binding ferritin-like protein
MNKFNLFLESDNDEEDKKDKDFENDSSSDLDDNDYLDDFDNSDFSEQDSSGDFDDNDYLDDSKSNGGIGEENTNSDYSKIIKCVYCAQVVYLNLKHIHLHCVGKHFDQIHSMSDCYSSRLHYAIDSLAELALQDKSTKIDNLANAHQYVSEITLETEDKYDYEAACTAIVSNLRHMLTCVESALEDHPNIDILMRMKEEYNKEINYNMERRLSISEGFMFNVK